MEKIKNIIERLFLMPLFGGVTTISGVIAGFLGSLYVTEISSAVRPWFWSRVSVFSPHASLFWAVVWIFGACFTGTFWAQARSSKRATDGLQDATKLVSTKTDSLTAKTEVLDGLVRQLYTLPPKGFLVKYRESVLLANEVFFNVQAPESTADEIAEAIRTQLTCILGLASGYDEDGQQAKYGCNLMIFCPSNALSDADADAIDSRMKFVDPGVTVRKIKGALDLILPLSVSSSCPEGPDLSLTAFALPVLDLPTVDANNIQDISILPGAPLAFVKRAEAVIESPEDWFERVAPFSEKVREELQQFFNGQRNAIQSFVSIPLYDETPASGEDFPIGILNIHRNIPNNLLAEKLELFAPLLVPITTLLGRLMSDYKKRRVLY